MNSFRACVTAAIGVVVLACAVTLSTLLGHAMSRELTRSQGQALQALARGVAATVAPALQEAGAGPSGPPPDTAAWQRVMREAQTPTTMPSGEPAVRLLLLDHEGRTPEGAPESAMPAPLQLPPGTEAPGWHTAADGRRYLAGVAPVPTPTPSLAGWRVVALLPADAALVPMARLERVMASVVSAAVLASMLAAWCVAGSLSRPVVRTDRAARRIEAGEFDAPMPPPGGPAELRSLNASLAGMTRALRNRERALIEANERLEARVEERTQALARANAELQTLARHDALTGLPNRRAADDRLAAEMGRHQRTQSGLGVLMVDIDRFKSINDSHGHAVGDAVLQQVAGTLAVNVRASDFVARMGGEEFVVLLSDVGADGALQAAEKLRQAIAQAEVPIVGRVTVSIGVAMRAECYLDGATALAAADAALYTAKRGGRNRVARGLPAEVLLA